MILLVWLDHWNQDGTFEYRDRKQPQHDFYGLLKELEVKVVPFWDDLSIFEYKNQLDYTDVEMLPLKAEEEVPLPMLNALEHVDQAFFREFQVFQQIG